ncbi:MAG: glycosyltransferase [Bacteroidales bacterium]|nr:glycosyltransferase [Bacteroidales bacterium]
MKKRVIVSVSNDLVADHRVHKTCLYFYEKGYDVWLVGRALKHSLPVYRIYRTHRIRLLFHKKFLFYAELNIRLFFYLLFKKVDLLISNDLDTLPANYFASRLKRISLLYDSHEYFTEVPELVHRKFVQSIWKRIEASIVPKLPVAITVNDSLAQMYEKKYGTKFISIRNVPIKANFSTNEKIPPFFTNEKQITHLLLYQGSLNIGRGIEKLIDCMLYLDPNFGLLIIGSGDMEQQLKKQVTDLNLTARIHFTGKLPFESLHLYTRKAFLGFSLEENLGLNYFYALPNKLFDYIHAGVPVVCSDFPEMRNIVQKYNIGVTTYANNGIELAKLIKEICQNVELYHTWKNNCKLASEELCWEKEKSKYDECLQILSAYQKND